MTPSNCPVLPKCFKKTLFSSWNHQRASCGFSGSVYRTCIHGEIWKCCIFPGVSCLTNCFDQPCQVVQAFHCSLVQARPNMFMDSSPACCRRHHQGSGDLESICSVGFRFRRAEAKAAVSKQGRNPQAGPEHITAVADELLKVLAQCSSVPHSKHAVRGSVICHMLPPHSVWTDLLNKKFKIGGKRFGCDNALKTSLPSTARVMGMGWAAAKHSVRMDYSRCQRTGHKYFTENKTSPGLVVSSSSRQSCAWFLSTQHIPRQTAGLSHLPMSCVCQCIWPVWVYSFYGAFISLPPPKKVSFFSFVISLMRQGIKVLCSPNWEAAGKAPLQGAGYCSVDTKKPKSSKKECLEAGPRRKELQGISHCNKGRSIYFAGKYNGFLIATIQEVTKATCGSLLEGSMSWQVPLTPCTHPK